MVGEFKSLGELLRETRLKKGLDLRDVSEKLKISYRYLKYLEDDLYDKVSLSEFYKKGILKKYANFLGVDEKEVLKLYYSQYKVEEKVKPPEKKESSKSLWRYGVYVIVALIVFVTLYFTIKSTYTPSIPQPFIDTYTYDFPSSTYTEPYLEKKQELTSDDLNSYTSSIKVVAHDKVWIRVAYEDKVIYEGILKNGDVLTWTYTSLYFHIGNAGGLEIFYNDKSLGNLGKRGEVIKIKVP